MAVFHLFSHQESCYHFSHLTGQDRGQLCLICAWPNRTFAHFPLVYTGVTQRFDRKCWYFFLLTQLHRCLIDTQTVQFYLSRCIWPYDKCLQFRTSLTSIKKHTSKLSAATAMSSILNCRSWKLYIFSILQMTGPGYTTSQIITAVRTSNRTRKITGKDERKKISDEPRDLIIK